MIQCKFLCVQFWIPSKERRVLPRAWPPSLSPCIIVHICINPFVQYPFCIIVHVGSRSMIYPLPLYLAYLGLNARWNVPIPVSLPEFWGRLDFWVWFWGPEHCRVLEPCCWGEVLGCFSTAFWLWGPADKLLSATLQMLCFVEYSVKWNFAGVLVKPY